MRSSGSMELPRSYGFSQELPEFGSENRFGLAVSPGSLQDNRWSRRSQWLGFALFLTFLVAIGLAVAVAILATQKKPCVDPTCIEVAGSILSKMETDVNPCEDFYQFACGKWLKENPIPATMTGWGQYIISQEKVNARVKDILEEGVKPGLMMLRAFLTARKFYSSCVSQSKNSSSADDKNVELLATIDRLVGKSDSLILSNFTTILAKIRREIGGNYIFDLKLHSFSEGNDSSLFVYLDQPKFGISATFLRDPKYTKQRQNYMTFIASTWKVVFSTEQARARTIANDILKLEMAMANISTPDPPRMNYSSRGTEMTLDELKNLTRKETALDWDIFFDQTFPVSATNGTSQDEAYFDIVVVDFNYFQQLGSVLNVDYNGRDILNYLKWRIIQDLGKESSDKLRAIFFENEKVTTGLQLPKPRWHACVETTSSLLGEAVSTRYMQKYFADNNIHQFQSLLSDLREAFGNILTNLDWLDFKAQGMALQKLKKMKAIVGQRVGLFDISVLQKLYKNLPDLKPGSSHFSNYLRILQWAVTVKLSEKLRLGDILAGFSVMETEINPYHSYENNEIHIPVGLLQPPFFLMPMQVLNYAALGFIIGHEMAHGYDYTGLHYDANGNYHHWLDPKTWNSYTERSRCFIDQYSNYKVNFGGSLWHVDGDLTLNENIADNGGLGQAFLAYKVYTERAGTERQLPGLEAYTPTQLFFIYFAQMECQAYTTERLQHNMLIDGHSPSEFRVKGPLQNFEEFYSTWNCPVNSSDNSRKAGGKLCRLW